MPASMNYTTLVSDAKSYLERPNDAALDAQLPRLVMLAENRIAADLRILGVQETAASTLTVGTGIIAKPAYWRRTNSFNITKANGERKELLPRTYEFCRQYWPTPATQGEPRYYCDYDFDNFLVVPTPSAALAFELLYVARLTPLDASTQTNWLTANAPQLLLAAVLLEADIWLKNSARIESRTNAYNGAVTALRGEDGSRVFDRSIVLME